MNRIWKCFFLLLLFCFCQISLFGQNSKKIIDSLEVVLKTSKEDTSKVKVLNALAFQLRNTGDIVKAKKYSETAISLANQLDYKLGNAVAYNMLGILDMEKGSYPSAMNNYKVSLKINEGIENKLGAANNISNMGSVYRRQGNYPEALKYYKTALKIYEEIENKDGQLSVNNNIGSIYGALANYPEALKNFQATLKLARETENKYGTAISLKNIGTIYYYQKNFSESLRHNQESLHIMEDIGNKSGIASVYNAIGDISHSLGNNEEAFRNFQIALKLYQELGYKKDIAQIYNSIGIVLGKLTNHTQALTNFKAALKIREEIGDKDGISESYGSIGSELAAQAALLKPVEARLKYYEAIPYLNKKLSIAKEIGYQEGIKGAYLHLSEIYNEIKDYKSALEYKNLYVQLKDSLMNNETTQKLEKLRTDFKVEMALNEEKVLHEKVLVEQKFKSEKELTEEKVKKEKAIEIEKLKYDFALSEGRSEQERVLFEQKFESERKQADENARHQQSMAEVHARQQVKDSEAKVLLEKEKAAKQRRTEVYLAGMIGLALVSIFTIIFIRQQNQKRRAVDKAETGHKMAELELQSLRAQLNPHFMFNSLNAIQDLILKEDNHRSHLYLSRFSKLLRMLLDNTNQPFVSVRQEIDFLELYLALENLRIPDLQFSIEKDAIVNAEERMIPNMMLQPYIENAIWHGLSHKKENRKLQIRIHENGNATEFEIEDNGVGRKKAEEMKSLFRKGHHSKGMELLSKRFSLLSKEYGAVIQTSVTDLGNNGDVTGTLVKIDVPFSLSDRAKQLTHDTNNHN